MEIVALIVEYILQNYAGLFDVYAEIFFFLKKSPVYLLLRTFNYTERLK